MAYRLDLREQVVEFVDAGGGITQATRLFHCQLGTIDRRGRSPSVAIGGEAQSINDWALSFGAWNQLSSVLSGDSR